MKKVVPLTISFILFLSFLFFTGCVSVKSFNSKLNDLHNEKQLKQDIDFVYKRLQKLHPNLYGYIPKPVLDFKFDSLKATIKAPMTSNEFYFKLSPVVSSIKQGHTRLFPLTKKLTKKEEKIVDKQGTSPLSKLGFEMFDSKLFITKNQLGDTTLKTGTELVSINNLNPVELISKFKNTFSSDGYNQSFTDNAVNREFSRYYYFQNGRSDSVFCELKYNNITRSTYLKYKPNVKIEKKQSQKNESDTLSVKKGPKKRQLPKVDESKPYYFKMLESDSNIAYMKIRTFSVGNQNSFYKKSFKEINASNTKGLILDLRDNFGGRLNNASKLYSYLADTNFYFVDKFELSSRTSLFQTNYLKGQPVIKKLFRLTLGLPSKIISMGIGLFRINKGSDGKFYFNSFQSKLKKPNPNRYEGKVYVLINGGTFSASSLLSSNLKGSGRAIFVGEETGGAYNGCVAGFMPVYKLPGSKLNIKFGIAQIQPFFKTEIIGRGIFPDIEVFPTIEDRLKGIDPELTRVLEDFKKSNE